MKSGDAAAAPAPAPAPAPKRKVPIAFVLASASLMVSIGIVAWLVTVALGMTLRIAVQGRDFKPTFVIVTTVFVGAGMLGWRAAVRKVAARRASRAVAR